jgi:hypothetical protein
MQKNLKKLYYTGISEKTKPTFLDESHFFLFFSLKERSGKEVGQGDNKEIDRKKRKKKKSFNLNRLSSNNSTFHWQVDRGVSEGFSAELPRDRTL